MAARGRTPTDLLESAARAALRCLSGLARFRRPACAAVAVRLRGAGSVVGAPLRGCRVAGRHADTSGAATRCRATGARQARTALKFLQTALVGAASAATRPTLASIP